jgi:hypothetical protein
METPKNPKGFRRVIKLPLVSENFVRFANSRRLPFLRFLPFYRFLQFFSIRRFLFLLFSFSFVVTLDGNG